MPEFEDNSILGDSIYQHINFEGREVAHHGPVDMKMFEQDEYLHSDENGKNNKGMFNYYDNTFRGIVEV